MARVNQVITDFSTGEISPLSEGRVRTVQYASACRKLENFIVSARGGVRRRPGFNYVQETKGGPVRLIPFIFNREQSYILELGDFYMRFYRDHGVLVEDVIRTADKYGDRIVKNYLGPSAQAFAPGDIYEIATPWSVDHIWDIHIAQANDIMIMVHPAYPVKRLGRYGAYDWRIEDPAFTDAPWSAGTGYPQTVCFFQQRLWFGGSPTKPQTLWASRVGDFYKFTVTADPDEIQPDDALELSIASYTQEAIQWLDSRNVMLIGTTGSEQRLTPDQYISVNNLPNIVRTSSYGSRNIMPVRIGELTIFVQGSGRQLRSYSQNNRSAIEQYVSRDLAWFAEHITKTGIIAHSYELVPDSILWMLRADGTLLSMTHDPSVEGDDFSAMGWARHPSDGQFISVQTIPNEEADETWVCTLRDGKYIIEWMNPDVYTDSCLTTPEDNTTALPGVGGLDHLEGKEVDIIVDDAVQNSKTVTGGQVLFDTPGIKAEVGLKFVSLLETVPFNDGNSPGTNLGSSQRWGQIYIKVVESALPKINGERPSPRTPSTPIGTGPALVSGDYDITNLGWDLAGTIEVEQDLPKPTQVVAVYGIYNSNIGQ